MSLVRRFSLYASMIRTKTAPIWSNIDVVLSTIILLGIGPEIQLIVDASLSQRRDTLYESAYGDYMVVDTSVIDNYLSPYSIPYIICGLILALIIRAKTYQDFAVFSAVASFVMWMLYDGILGQFGLVTFPSAFPNIGYNLIGSILFAIGLCTVIMTTRYVVRPHISKVNLFRGFVALTISVFFALVATGITSFFLKPIPISFQTTLEPPTGVFYHTYKGEAAFEPAGHKWDGKAFRGPFPDTPVAKRISLAGEGLVATFEGGEIGAPRMLKIWLFKGCTFTSPNKLPLSSPAISEKILSPVTFASGAEFANWVITSDTKMSLTKNTNDYGAFWLEKVKDGKFKVSTYISDGGSIHIGAPGRSTFAASAMAVTRDNGRLKAKPVEFSVVNGTSSHRFRLAPVDPIDENASTKCEPVSPDAFSRSVEGTVVVAVEEDESSKTALDTKLKASFAYISADTVDPADVSDTYLGAAAIMTIGGEPPKLEVKHALPSLAERGEGMIVEGKFDVRADESARIKLSGYATRLWRGDVRVSPTRWESLDDEWKRWILAGACAALLAIFRFVGLTLWKYRKSLVRD